MFHILNVQTKTGRKADGEGLDSEKGGAMNGLAVIRSREAQAYRVNTKKATLKFFGSFSFL